MVATFIIINTEVAENNLRDIETINALLEYIGHPCYITQCILQF